MEQAKRYAFIDSANRLGSKRIMATYTDAEGQVYTLLTTGDVRKGKVSADESEFIYFYQFGTNNPTITLNLDIEKDRNILKFTRKFNFAVDFKTGSVHNPNYRGVTLVIVRVPEEIADVENNEYEVKTTLFVFLHGLEVLQRRNLAFGLGLIDPTKKVTDKEIYVALMKAAEAAPEKDEKHNRMLKFLWEGNTEEIIIINKAKKHTILQKKDGIYAYDDVRCGSSDAQVFSFFIEHKDHYQNLKNRVAAIEKESDTNYDSGNVGELTISQEIKDLKHINEVPLYVEEQEKDIEQVYIDTVAEKDAIEAKLTHVIKERKKKRQAAA